MENTMKKEMQLLKLKPSWITGETFVISGGYR